MELTQVECRSCSALLEIAPGQHFLRCHDCGANLEVKPTASGATTEVYRCPTLPPGPSAAIPPALEQLNHDWNLRRRTLMVHTRHGVRLVEPTATGPIAMICIAAALALLWIVQALRWNLEPADGHSLLPLNAFLFISFLFLCSILATGLKGLKKARQYQSENAQYQRQRASLLHNQATPHV